VQAALCWLTHIMQSYSSAQLLKHHAQLLQDTTTCVFMASMARVAVSHCSICTFALQYGLLPYQP
jgi:hypothetical protein